MTSYEDDLRTVGEVSELLGLSVRTLHHWEERGLVVPSERSWANYRLYSLADVARLQQIMIYRATGMRLDDIAKVIDDGDAVVHLNRQRDLLMSKENELHKMVQAVDKLLEDAMSKNELDVNEVAEILGDANFPDYQVEAEETWGETDDWTISQRATASMGKKDWEQLKEKTAQVESSLVTGMRAGLEPGSDEANALAEAHRELLSAFFPISYNKHVLLARGYTGDPRFRAYYEKRGEGLTDWLVAAINANAVAHGVDPENAEWV